MRHWKQEFECQGHRTSPPSAPESLFVATEKADGVLSLRIGHEERGDGGVFFPHKMLQRATLKASPLTKFSQLLGREDYVGDISLFIINSELTASPNCFQVRKPKIGSERLNDAPKVTALKSVWGLKLVSWVQVVLTLTQVGRIPFSWPSVPLQWDRSCKILGNRDQSLKVSTSSLFSTQDSAKQYKTLTAQSAALCGKRNIFKDSGNLSCGGHWVKDQT